MNKQKLFFISFLLLLSSRALAQEKEVNQATAIWYQYYHSYHLSEKWMVNSDIALRHPWIDHISRYHFRTGLSYRLMSKMRVEGGYLYGKSPGEKSSFEHRLHQEIDFQHSISKLQFKHRLRFEEQFISPSRAVRFWNIRHRYRLQLSFTLWKISSSARISLTAGNEIFLNKGGNSDAPLFDQNRILSGLVFQSGSQNQISILYNRQYSSTPVPDVFSLDHIIWISFRQTFFAKK